MILKCDFCSATPPVCCGEPCADYVWETAQDTDGAPRFGCPCHGRPPGRLRDVVRVAGDWQACPPCALLVEAGDAAALVARACDAFGVPDTVIVAEMHRGYWLHRR